MCKIFKNFCDGIFLSIKSLLFLTISDLLIIVIILLKNRKVGNYV